MRVIFHCVVKKIIFVLRIGLLESRIIYIYHFFCFSYEQEWNKYKANINKQNTKHIHNLYRSYISDNFKLLLFSFFSFFALYFFAFGTDPRLLSARGRILHQ